ncbi:MAG: hypothetical protein KUG77_30190 [Nannocystaceae bacterium]|nr:hypothetical protein [Nannocystaceae bacterium]
MVKAVITFVDLSQWAQLSLLIFAGVFIAVSIRTLLQSSAMTRDQARLVLDDETSPEP